MPQPQAQTVDPATTQNQAGDQLQQLSDDVQAEDGEHDDADAAEHDAQGQPKKPLDERERLIRKQSRQLTSRSRALGRYEAENEALRAELQRLREAQPRQQTAADDGAQGGNQTQQRNDDPDAPRYSQKDVDRLAQERAEQARDSEEVATRTKAMVAAGKAFGNFAEMAAEVAEDLPFLTRAGAPTPFILAVLGSDKPEMRAELMVHLARNPELRDELSELNERQMARRIGAIETSLVTKPEKRSQAARPIAPVNGNARDSGPKDSDPPDVWLAKERARMKAQREARGR